MRKHLVWLASVSSLAAAVLLGPSAFADRKADQVVIGSLSGSYLAARVAEIDDDLPGAIEYYRRALDFDPDNRQIQQSLMLALITSGDVKGALPYAEKLKSVVDVERFSRVALAVDAFGAGKYGDAVTLLQLADESDLDRLITRLMTAWAKVGLSEGRQAVADLDALDGPEWFDLFASYHRALVAEAAGLADEADAAYQTAIDNAAAGGAAPETWLRAAEAYATFLARKGDRQAALAVVDKAESFAPGRLPMMALRGKIEAGEALAPFVADAAAGASEVLLNVGGALNRGGGEPFVRLYLHMALALKPDSDAVLLQLASVAEQQEEPEVAIALYERVPESSPLKRAAELQLGLNLADLKRHDEAITHLKKLLDADPDDMRGYLALGGVYASKEDFKSAAATYDMAVERLKQPTAANWNIFYQRGIAYERLKQWPKAEPNFRKALELQPDQPQVMNYLGYSWVDMSMNLDEGLEMIRRAVDLRPSDGYIVDSLGWAYYRLNRFDEAVVELERAVSLKPEDPILNDHLGDAYWRSGRRLEATFQWAHARDLKPDPDVLLSVQKKLKEGLPPLEGKTALEAPPKPAPKAGSDTKG
jgi:tetratricopeptide (TPR) repeat protein